MNKLRVLGLLCGLLLPFMAIAETVDGLYVFGDSLSDNGNLYASSKSDMPASPPYYQGRFSNGPVWVEDLTPMLDLPSTGLHDFAVGSAQTRGGLVHSFLEQIKDYVRTNPKVDPNGLYIVWIGPNDYFFHPRAPLSRVKGNVRDTIEGIRLLAKHGGKYFLVLNLPDMGLTPLVYQLDAKQKSEVYSQHLHALVTLHNQELDITLKKFAGQNKRLDIVQMDASALFNEAVENPKQYQLTNVKEPCYQGNFQGKPDVVCTDPNNYLFWDIVHPTARVHQELAKVAKQVLAENNIS